MEIWIIGGIVVALMVYISTRIKKSAARAFEEETVETPEFSIVKPEGFINPIGDDSEFAFEAHSKDFGEGEAEKFYQAQAKLRIVDDADFPLTCDEAKQAVDKILSEEINDVAPGIKSFWLKGEKAENGVEMKIYRKIIGTGPKVFDLQVTVLKEFQDLYAEKAEKLIKSFAVK